MDIGEIAGHFGLATHVLRHWETIGLLSPVRASGGRRRYDRFDLYRVASILLAKEAGLTQEQIADAVSASQSQVSRILAGRSLRRSKLFDDICTFVNSAALGVSPDLVRANHELIDAIASVWNGTATQATAIAAIIRGLGALHPVRVTPSNLFAPPYE